MPKVSTGWPPEEIEAISEELIAGRATLAKVGERKGISGEHARQLLKLGSIDALRLKRLEESQNQIRELVAAGRSDEEIAREIGVPVKTLSRFRKRLQIKRPNPMRKHTRVSMVAWARRFYRDYGYTPAATDCNITEAKTMNQTERVERYYESGAPALTAIQREFGSFSEFIRETGLPPAPTGGAAHGRFKVREHIGQAGG